jgi:hypothetical protein
VILRCYSTLAICLAIGASSSSNLSYALAPQVWRYDTEKPVLELGTAGAFDDTHIFAPCVAFENGQYTMWYCGSRGAVVDRVFSMGRATSNDGITFSKDAAPVYNFGDGKHSILTPALLRGDDGSVLRENGKLQLWFAAADMTKSNPLHTLRRSESEDGIHWSPPSPPLLENLYAPTVIKDGNEYRMWYTDVSSDPWIIRHARSADGTHWTVTESPSIAINQAWEERRLFYPYVAKSGDEYWMWYGAYWKERSNTTAIGFASSNDGITWSKHPMNPVIRPNPARPWESHYTTSQTVMKLPDGRWRAWYATRKAPPFENKYFAVGTAIWNGPRHAEVRSMPWPDRAKVYREKMAEILALPKNRIAIEAVTHRSRNGDGFDVESISYACEPNSRATALLYLPHSRIKPAPALLIACGHGGSKSCLYAQYAGQLYSKLGVACLVVDTIGEEERSIVGAMGTREHDLGKMDQPTRIDFIRNKLKRSTLGKIAWDLMRGIDYLETRPEIDASRIGIAGYSLGGTSASCVAILDTRVKAAIICGWGFSPLVVNRAKECTRLPYEDFSDLLRFDEMTALFAPHCAALFYSGSNDSVIDAQEGGPALVRDIDQCVAGARDLLKSANIEATIESKFEYGADHRPLFLSPDGVKWMIEQLLPQPEPPSIPAKTIKFGEWAESQGQQIEKLYDTDERERGAIVVDIGVKWLSPKELACFPDKQGGGTEYTFDGWVEHVLRQSEPSR